MLPFLTYTDNVDQAMNLLLMQGAVYAPPSSAVVATRIAATRVCKGHGERVML